MTALTVAEVQNYAAAVGLTPDLVAAMRIAEKAQLLQAVGQAKQADALADISRQMAISNAQFAVSESRIADAAGSIAASMPPPAPKTA
jgi:hypothetical protein